MFIKFFTVIFTLFVSASTIAIGQNSPVNIASFNAKQIKTKLITTLGVEIIDVKKTPMAGLAEVATNQGLFYTSFDGEYLIQGKLYSLGKEVANLTEKSLAYFRVTGMERFEDDMIVFQAKIEKHVITVFSDITCEYCRKLHSQIDEYNDLGITVRYLAYPRAGIKDKDGAFTDGFKNLRSVWCSEDPHKAITQAKLGVSIPSRVCDKPIAEEFSFGRQVGVNSTPTIITKDGTMMPGYRDPSDLFKILESM